MKIRQANIEDLDQLVILFNDYRLFYRKDSDLAEAKVFLKDRILEKDSVIYVCSMNHKLVGFVQLYPIFSSTRMKKMWLLNDLFVNPSHRGKGISILLMDKAKSLVKESKACTMILETEKSNQIGNSLYPRAGFELDESINFYEWENPDLIY